MPGLSVWVFYPFGHLFGVDDPTGPARGVQLCSLAALVGLALFAWRCVPAAEREPWLWAVALTAVNPVAVLYHRKLWPPCMLPLFSAAFVISWWHRDRRWGAAAWGLVGASLGQIHVSGFLFAFAVFLTTATSAGRRASTPSCWLARSGSREIATTESPRSRSCATRRDPIRPVAPVMATLIGSGSRRIPRSKQRS